MIIVRGLSSIGSQSEKQSESGKKSGERNFGHKKTPTILMNVGV